LIANEIPITSWAPTAGEERSYKTCSQGPHPLSLRAITNESSITSGAPTGIIRVLLILASLLLLSLLSVVSLVLSSSV
jgi:hypothetical protein